MSAATTKAQGANSKQAGRRMSTKPLRLTVNSAWLIGAAESLENEARGSLYAWIILGQSERYADNMGKAAVLRRAAQMRNISERREFLRNNGARAA